MLRAWILALPLAVASLITTQVEATSQEIGSELMVPWASSEVNDGNYLAVREFLPLQEENVIQRRLLESSAGTYVRPIVQSISNSSKLVIKFNEEIEFPDDMVD